MTSLFKFRFCFAGGSLDLKQKPYSPGTVTSDYFQWHFQLFPITIPGTRGKRSHVLQHQGFFFWTKDHLSNLCRKRCRARFGTLLWEGNSRANLLKWDLRPVSGRVLGILRYILPCWVILRKLLHFPQALTGSRTHFSAGTRSFSERLLNALWML